MPERLARDPLLEFLADHLGVAPCWVTGGYPRDRLLGRTTRDLDLVLPGDLGSTAPAARRLAKALGSRAHRLGRPPRSVWRIETSDLKVELWPLGDLTLEDDARRRDFTVNTLMWMLPHGPLSDPLGGRSDLEAGVLRAVARANLADDPVRLLRGPRFLARMEELRLEATTARWIAELAPRLAEAPRERVGQELLALVTAPGCARGLASLLELGLLGPAAPAAAVVDSARLASSLDAYERLAHPHRHPVPAAVAAGGDAATLVPLLLAWGRPRDDELAAYAWPRDVRLAAVRAAALVEAAGAALNAPVSARRELVHEAGEAFPALIAAAAALAPGDGAERRRWRSWWHLWRERGDVLRDPALLLDADEVQALAGVGPGPELGRLLHELVRAQVRGAVRSRLGARRLIRALRADDQSSDQTT